MTTLHTHNFFLATRFAGSFCVTKMSRWAADGRKCHKKNHLKPSKKGYFAEHRKSPVYRLILRFSGHFLYIGMTGFEPAASCSQIMHPFCERPHGCVIFGGHVSRSCDKQDRLLYVTLRYFTLLYVTLRQKSFLWRRVRLPVLPVCGSRPVWSCSHHAP